MKKERQKGNNEELDFFGLKLNNSASWKLRTEGKVDEEEEEPNKLIFLIYLLWMDEIQFLKIDNIEGFKF